MTNTQQQKLDTFFAAIAAVKALGDGYQKMVYALEDDLYVLQMEILADEKKERDYEKATYMARCFSAKLEAEQREKEIKARLKGLRSKMTRMIKAGQRAGEEYDAVYHEQVSLMIELPDVWSKYNRLMSDQ